MDLEMMEEVSRLQKENDGRRIIGRQSALFYGSTVGGVVRANGHPWRHGQLRKRYLGGWLLNVCCRLNCWLGSE